MRVSGYPSGDPFTFCQMMIVGGRGLWMNCASVEPSSPAAARASTAGRRVALVGLAGLYILQALRHRELRTREAVQQLPSVVVVTEVEFGPKHKREGRNVLSINHMAMWMP